MSRRPERFARLEHRAEHPVLARHRPERRDQPSLMPEVRKRRKPPSPSGSPSAAKRASGELTRAVDQPLQHLVDRELRRDREHRVADRLQRRADPRRLHHVIVVVRSPDRARAASGRCARARRRGSLRRRGCATSCGRQGRRTTGAGLVDVSRSTSSYAAREVVPERAVLEVARAELPALLGIVEPFLQPHALLVARDVEEDLHDGRALVAEHLLERADVLVAPCHTFSSASLRTRTATMSS